MEGLEIRKVRLTDGARPEAPFDQRIAAKAKSPYVLEISVERTCLRLRLFIISNVAFIRSFVREDAEQLVYRFP